ncbi:hypothetical protein M413DRAFT_28455 [Hebeloma cylindrosporum]|uniref:Uncharacterized protein n=1 Tax=Hebeloma cylindrosporum TaxID=76867 RepID=A0A0C3CAQ7_HEBCY|nr:hypothetical protein M413DRAFT_28455 [Hebeloma cylindrosporum h7]
MDVNGLVYPLNFLDSLPVLSTSPPTTTATTTLPSKSSHAAPTIRKLSPTQFADLHLQHTLAHPPDNVLFPFLHGLEGDNHAQNTFFASSSFASSSGTSFRSASNHVHANTRITPKVPNYRGLVWVVCEDDLEQAGDEVSLRILRRKPLQEPNMQGVAPTPSSSSEGSDSAETEGEDDGEYSESSDFHDDLDEEEQDMLMMIQAESSEAEAEARRLGFNGHDADEDSDGGVSTLLASPVHLHPHQHDDRVRVVIPCADEEEGVVVVVDDKEKDDKLDKDEQHYEGKHMHPVAHRPPITTTAVAAPVSAPVPVPFNPHGLGITTTLDKSVTSTSISSAFTSSSVSSPSSPSSMFTTPISTPSSSTSEQSSLSHTPALADDVKPPQQQQQQQQQQLPPPPKLTSTVSANTVTQASSDPAPSSSALNDPQQRSSKLVLKHPTDPSAPPFLTSTFRPKELVRRTKRIMLQKGNEVKVLGSVGEEKDKEKEKEKEREDEGSWEFVPAKVPNGISLRNFGIQVPIYATLSDIVVYSPYGATPGALALARRFRTAIRKKRVERMQAAGLGLEATATAENPSGDNNDTTAPSDDPDKGFLQYNVFVLDGTEDDLRAAAPHLMMRICGAGVPGGENPAASSSGRNSASSVSRLRSGQTSAGQGGNKGNNSTDNNNNNSHPNSGSGKGDGDKLEKALEREQDRQNLQDAAEEVDRASRAKMTMGKSESAESAGAGAAKKKKKQKPSTDTSPNTSSGSSNLTSPGCSTSSSHSRPSLSSRSRSVLDVGAHTDRPDGHIIELGLMEKEEARALAKQKKAKRAKADADAAAAAAAEEEKEKERAKEKERDVGMDVDMVNDMDLDVSPSQPQEEGVAMDVDVEESEEEEDGQEEEEDDDEDDWNVMQNTVDFALREREEMRDLTKASEIISLYPPSASSPGVPAAAAASSNPTASTPIPPSHAGVEGDPTPIWDPRVGQVFLGNSGDVPLAPDVPTQFRHATSVARDVEARGGEDTAKYAWETMTRHMKGVDGLLAQYGAQQQEDEEEEEEKGEGEGQDQKADEFLPEDDPFNYLATNDPECGFGFDICVECHDLAPFPSTAHLRAAEEHLAMMDVMWRERWDRAWAARQKSKSRTSSSSSSASASIPPPPAPPRPPPHANAVIHLPFPSSPSNTQSTMVALMAVVRFLEKWVRPVPVPVVKPPPPPAVEPPTPEMRNLWMIGNVDPKRSAAGSGVGAGAGAAASSEGTTQLSGASSRRWSSVTSLMPSFTSFPGVGGGGGGGGSQSPLEVKNVPGQATVNVSTPPPNAPLPPHPRSRAMTSPASQPQLVHPPNPIQGRTRPLKILLYSSDGYTESSVPALCLLMAIKGLLLPEAYLELQVEKRRSFFVYQSDLGILRKVECRLKEEREREKEKERERERERERMAASAYFSSMGGGATINANGKRTAPAHVPTRGGFWTGSGTQVSSSSSASTSPSSGSGAARPPLSTGHGSSSFIGRPAAKSVSFAQPPAQVIAAAARYQQQQQQHHQHQQQQLQNQQQPSIPSSQGVSSQNAVIPGSSSISSHGPQQQQQQHFEFGSMPAQPKPQYPVFSATAQLQQHLGEGGGGGGYGGQHQMGVFKGRPRASTSPWLPSLFGGDHQSWFNDPRFDGSFPSRVLPFLYLGNLNHASNVYMLHALGITHVVSVGECALVPPPHHMSMHAGSHRPGSATHFIPGKGPGGHGSLWIEEREGRIKVLDIKGVCDDGIDTLEPQLEPICDWIDRARLEGGQVLVHCRVGVSRSATVTIAYVMKHLGLPLVDAYLIVRSRRLSVLIQPNMRLLYNLCGWEIKLAKERANKDERKLKKELSRTLTWPYLAKEVHALNEKYLH